MTSTHPVDLARVGVAAVETYFRSKNLQPVTAGDGRFVVYVPGNAETADLQLTLAATPAARGILARVKARRTVDAQNWGRALVLTNKWNRSCPLPHATLVTRGSGGQAVGAFLLEGSLPQAEEYSELQVARFIDTIVLGARQFWAGEAIRLVTRPWDAAAVPVAAAADAV